MMKKRFISILLALLLCFGLTLSVTAATGADGFVYDEADLLTESEEAMLADVLMDVSRTYEAQIVVCTMDSVDGGDIDSYVDILYDSSGFGYGDRKDGVLLLVCMNIREYRILSNGYPGVAIDPDVIAQIGDEIVSDLSDGNYAGAFQGFAEECAYYLNGYLYGFPFDVGGSLIISLVIGIVAGVVVAFVLKGQLKTVRSQNRAHEYVKPGSMRITSNYDLFLYRNVTRTKKESSSSSGSSVGSARSKGGGSF